MKKYKLKTVVIKGAKWAGCEELIMLPAHDKVIEAFQLSYEMAKGIEKTPSWFANAVNVDKTIKVYYTDKIHGSQYCKIKTLEGTINAGADDFIIQGIDGKIYPCKSDRFEKTYEEVE